MKVVARTGWPTNRHMQFNDIIGQTATQHTLRQLVLHDRVPHALLLLGPEGSGQLALALAYARYLMCTNPTQDDACGTCAHCRKIDKLAHPDLHFSYPTVGSKATSDQYLREWRDAIGQNPYLNVNDWLQHIGAENRQGNITKEECVAIVKKLSLKTFEADIKVMIIWMPEYLAKEGNRLLKIIEEPPANTYFILVAESAERILNTILSRCQLVKVPKLSDLDVIRGLQRTHPDLGDRVSGIAHLSEGNFNTALQLAQEKGNAYDELFLDWMRKAYKGHGVELVTWTEQFAKLGRENQKHFLFYALHFMRELLVHKVTGQTDLRLQEAERASALKLAGILETDQLEHMVQLLTDCHYYIERNANPKILLLNIGIQLHQFIRRTHPDMVATH